MESVDVKLRPAISTEFSPESVVKGSGDGAGNDWEFLDLNTYAQRKEALELIKKRLFSDSNLRDKLERKLELTLAPANHARLYGNTLQQYKEFDDWLLDSTITDDIKKLAIAQLNDTPDQPLQLFRALQTLRFAKKEQLAEFQAAKLKLIQKLAEDFLAMDPSFGAKKQEYSDALVGYVATEWGLNPTVVSDGSNHVFARSTCSGEKLTYHCACMFSEIVEIYLSPAVILAELSSKNDQNKELLTYKDAEIACNSLLKSNRFMGLNASKYQVDKLLFTVSTADLERKLISAFDPRIMHPHMYIPICQAGIDGCDSIKQLCDFALQIISQTQAQGTPIQQLLLILFQTKVKQLCPEASNLKENVTTYLQGKHLDNNPLAVICNVLGADACNLVFAQPNKKHAPYLLANLSSFHFTQNMSNIYDRIDETTRVKILKCAIENGNYSCVKTMNKGLGIDQQYKLFFTAIEHGKLEIVEYFLNEMRLSIDEVIEVEHQRLLFGKSKRCDAVAFACDCKRLNLVRYFMRHYDIDVYQISRQEYTEAEAAPIIYQDVNLFEESLKKAKDAGKRSLLELFLSNYDEQQKVTLCFPNSNENLLEWACKHKQFYLVKLLLPNSAAVNEKCLETLKRINSNQAIKAHIAFVEPATLFEPHSLPDNGKQWTLFYKKKQFVAAVLEGRDVEMEYWQKAGVVIAVHFDEQQLLSWLQGFAQQNNHKAMSILLKGLRTKQGSKLLLNESFIKVLFFSNPPWLCYREVVSCDKTGFTQKQKADFLFKLFKQSLVVQRFDVSEDILTFQSEMNTHAHQAISQLGSSELKGLAERGAQRFSIEAIVKLLSFMAPQDALSLTQSQSFLQVLSNKLGVENGDQLLNKLKTLNLPENISKSISAALIAEIKIEVRKNLEDNTRVEPSDTSCQSVEIPSDFSELKFRADIVEEKTEL